MTIVQFILIAVALAIMVVGVWMILRGLRERKATRQPTPIEYDKNGIPIIPRHERDIVDTLDFDDTVAGETVIVPSRDHLQPVMRNTEAQNTELGQVNDFGGDWQDSDNYMYDPEALKEELAKEESVTYNFDYDSSAQETAADSEFDYTHNATEGQLDNDIEARYVDEVRVPLNNEPTTDATAQSRHIPSYDADDYKPSEYEPSSIDLDEEEDVFSSLASATEHLMPAVETVDMPEFSDNSPMLDEHLLSVSQNEQNSPLNNAEENLNLTLMPNTGAKIAGSTVIEIIKQYGLIFGLMNMYHRYENKDGSGILWFSMMGIVDGEVSPFNVQLLPQTNFDGLILFLSLPHPKGLQGFDSMISTASLIANQLDMTVFDEEGNSLTRERRQQLREQVRDYQ